MYVHMYIYIWVYMYTYIIVPLVLGLAQNLGCGGVLVRRRKLHRVELLELEWIVGDWAAHDAVWFVKLHFGLWGKDVTDGIKLKRYIYIYTYIYIYIYR